MKAMQIQSYKEGVKFAQVDLPKPELKAGHVLVKIAASSVNTVDLKICEAGEVLAPISPKTPAVLGMDFAGTVEAIGEGVIKYSVGDEVYGCAGGLNDLPGALAEYIVADENLVALKAKNLSMREAAALPLVAITAYEGLTRAQTQAGQKVLVHGGTGGVGHIALQLAKHFGADVYATGSGDEKLKLIEELGATAINYRSESVADYVAKHTDGVGFDVVFDSVGDVNMLNSFEAAALNGHVASTVSMLEIDLTTVHLKGLSLHVVFMLIQMLHNHKREEHHKILNEVTAIVEAGGLKPILDEKAFSLEQAEEAYARLASGKAIGKVVIENK